MWRQVTGPDANHVSCLEQAQGCREARDTAADYKNIHDAHTSFNRLCQDWRRDLAVNAQEVRDGRRWSTTKAAFSGNTKLRNVPLSSCDSPPCPLDTICEMYQSQVEFSLGVQLQVLKRHKVSIVAPITGDRHVYPGDCTRNACGDGIGDFNQFGGIIRLFKVPMPGITIAEVITHLDVSRDTITEPDKSLDNSCFDVGEQCGHRSLQDTKLNRNVPLNSQLVLWNGGSDPIKFGKHRCLVSWLDGCAV